VLVVALRSSHVVYVVCSSNCHCRGFSPATNEPLRFDCYLGPLHAQWISWSTPRRRSLNGTARQTMSSPKHYDLEELSMPGKPRELALLWLEKADHDLVTARQTLLLENGPT